MEKLAMTMPNIRKGQPVARANGQPVARANGQPVARATQNTTINPTINPTPKEGTGNFRKSENYDALEKLCEELSTTHAVLDEIMQTHSLPLAEFLKGAQAVLEDSTIYSPLSALRSGKNTFENGKCIRRRQKTGLELWQEQQQHLLHERKKRIEEAQTWEHIRAEQVRRFDEALAWFCNHPDREKIIQQIKAKAPHFEHHKIGKIWNPGLKAILCVVYRQEGTL
jgi:hypothetical protein